MSRNNKWCLKKARHGVHPQNRTGWLTSALAASDVRKIVRVAISWLLSDIFEMGFISRKVGRMAFYIESESNENNDDFHSFQNENSTRLFEKASCLLKKITWLYKQTIQGILRLLECTNKKAKSQQVQETEWKMQSVAWRSVDVRTRAQKNGNRGSKEKCKNRTLFF